MPLLWHSEKSSELSSPAPSKLWAIRSTERCMRSFRTLGWWPVMSPLTPRLPVWSWPQRWDGDLLSAGTSATAAFTYWLICFAVVFSFRFWGACCTGGQRSWGRWRGSSLMRFITWETQVGFPRLDCVYGMHYNVFMLFKNFFILVYYTLQLLFS